MTIHTVYLANVMTMYLVGINEWLLHSFPNRVISPYSIAIESILAFTCCKNTRIITVFFACPSDTLWVKLKFSLHVK